MYTTLGIIILVIVLFAILIEEISKYLLKRLKLVPSREFPKIDRSIIEKFTSFDPVLGWEPQENTIKKKDTGHHKPDDPEANKIEYTTDKYGSRIAPVNRGIGEFKIATYGDSYCFCREVNDEETFQYRLSKEMGVHVSNYGAGNYGLDQAILRMKRRYQQDPADFVVMSVTAASIARILSVWKHYHEFGNVLAIKPKFKLLDCNLEYVQNPIEKKEELLNLKSHAGFFRKHDYHYENWFKHHQLSRPYALQLLSTTENRKYAFWSLIDFGVRYSNIDIPKIDTEHRKMVAKQATKRKVAPYHSELCSEFEDLYCRLIGEFVNFTTKHGATPIYLPLQQLQYVEYEQEYGRIDENITSTLASSYPDLIICDIRDELQSEINEVDNLYVNRGEGGHHSKEANEIIAKYLQKTIEGVRNET